MKPFPWQTWIVAPLLGLVSFGLLRSLLDPSMGKPPPLTFSQIPIAGWQIIKQEQIGTDPANVRPHVLANQRYLYRNQGQPQKILTVEVRHFLQRKLPVDTPQLINLFLMDKERGATLPLTIAEKQFSGNNYYSLFTYQQRAYLSACIDSSRNSTVNLSQFWQHRIDHDLRSQAIFSWLFGPASLIDQRCLWSQVSMPLKGAKLESVYATLISFWEEWFDWWRSHYPS